MSDLKPCPTCHNCGASYCPTCNGTGTRPTPAPVGEQAVGIGVNHPVGLDTQVMEHIQELIGFLKSERDKAIAEHKRCCKSLTMCTSAFEEQRQQLAAANTENERLTQHNDHLEASREAWVSLSDKQETKIRDQRAPTPQAVLDAGSAIHASLRYCGPFTRKQVWRVYPNVDGMPEALFTGTKEECRLFVLDRVFRAMLRALADEYGRVGDALFRALGEG